MTAGDERITITTSEPGRGIRATCPKQHVQYHEMTRDQARTEILAMQEPALPCKECRRTYPLEAGSVANLRKWVDGHDWPK